jgi:hypothetical protein
MRYFSSEETFSFTNNAHAGEAGNVVYDFWMIHFRFIEAQSKINNLLLLFRAPIFVEIRFFGTPRLLLSPEEFQDVSRSDWFRHRRIVKNASRLCIDLINVSQF